MEYVYAVRGLTLTLTLLSAFCFPLALPNELFQLGNPLLGIVALVPLYLAIRSAPTVRVATAVGAIFGGLSTLLANYWLMFFGDYSIWTISGTTIGYMGYNAILAAFLWTCLRSQSSYRPILFALAWTGYEYLKSIGFLGYPWGLAAYPLNSFSVVIQIVDITGIWGITLLVVLLNAVIAEVVLTYYDSEIAVAALSQRDSRLRMVAENLRGSSLVRNALFAGILVAIVVAYGIQAQKREIPQGGELDVVLVQQNADSWDVTDLQTPLLTAQNQTRLGLAASPATPDLIVWSETSLRFLYTEARAWYARNPVGDPFAEFLAELPAPLLTGSPFRSPDNEFAFHNSIILVSPDGSVSSWYGKLHLVPFAEYVPYWDQPAVRRFFQNVVGLASIWAPGPGYRLFEINTASGGPIMIGTPICFEDSFPDICRGFVLAGADVLINLTNNAWSRTNSAQSQHFVASRFRSIESRRVLIRSTNAGYTTVIDPWGEVIEGLPMFEAGFLRVSVPVYRPAQTVYITLGDYLPRAALVFLLGLLIYSKIAGRRSRIAKQRRRSTS